MWILAQGFPFSMMIHVFLIPAVPVTDKQASAVKLRLKKTQCCLLVHRTCAGSEGRTFECKQQHGKHKILS